MISEPYPESASTSEKANGAIVMQAAPTAARSFAPSRL